MGATDVQTKVAEVALHGVFLGTAISLLAPPVERAGPGEWLSSISALALMSAGLFALPERWERLGPSVRRWLLAGLVIVGQMVLQSLLRGTEDWLYAALQTLPWLGLVLLPVLGWPALPRQIERTFRWHAVAGVLMYGAALATNWDIMTAAEVRRDETLELKTGQFLLYAVYFVLFRFPIEGGIARAAALLGVLEIGGVAVASGTRQALPLLAAVILLTTWCILRARGEGEIRGRWRRVVRVLSFSVVVVAGASVVLERMPGGVELLSQRLLREAGPSSVAENARWEEVRTLLHEFDVVDFLVGRGVTGSFGNIAGLPADNVHIGYFRALLKGGLPLVGLILAGPVAWGVFALLRRRDSSTLAAAAMCAYFAIKNATGNVILANPAFYLIGLCAGGVMGVSTGDGCRAWRRRGGLRFRRVAAGGMLHVRRDL